MALTYLEAIALIEKSYGNEIRLGLERISALMELLGNPQERLSVIHVAGTNGKGSTCAMLSSILRQQGYCVGMYTSPHLECYNERFVIGGVQISNEEFCTCVEIVHEACQKLSATPIGYPTVFEMLTAIAFYWFEKRKVDFLVLEVGLGGRFDATNVIKKPLLSAITAIGLDHMDFLGDTVEAIAAEKSGIIKENIPCVLYYQQERVYNVVSHVCNIRHAKLYYAPPVVKIEKQTLRKTIFSVKSSYIEYEALALPLAGEFQIENCVHVLHIVKALLDLGMQISDTSVHKGLCEVKWKGRMEVVGENPLIVIDGAHNTDGISMLARAIETYFKGRRITLLLGVLSDKEYQKMADILIPLVHTVVLTEPDNSRRLDVDSFFNSMDRFHLPIYKAKRIEDALCMARSLTALDDMILCSGSLYMIGEIRNCLQKEKRRDECD